MADMAAAHKALDAHLRAEEGERLSPYLCLAGVPTIGVGATEYLDGRKVKLSDPPITREQMDRMLTVEIDRYVSAVLRMVGGECSTNQLVALVLCAYNIGLGGLEGSTMIKRHKAGDFPSAARAFTLWNKFRRRPGAPLEESDALTARRLRESALYMTPDNLALAAAPQAVESESPMTASPINRGGIAAAGTGVIAILSEAGASLGGLREPLGAARDFMASTLGVPPSWILPLMLVGVGLAVVYWRYKQRSGGWA